MDGDGAGGMTSRQSSAFPPAQFRFYVAANKLAQRGGILEGMVKSFSIYNENPFKTALALNKELIWHIMLDREGARMLLEHVGSWE